MVFSRFIPRSGIARSYGSSWGFFKFFLSLFLAVLGLCCYAGFSLVVASGGYSLVEVNRLLVPGAFLVAYGAL